MMLVVFLFFKPQEIFMNNKPIAVVDSGVGGLACLDRIRKALPHEDIIYFGDTANMPYGTKTEEQLVCCVRNFTEYLREYGVKMIVLACGTMSSTMIPFFYKNYPEILVQGIIEPAVSAVSRACSDGDKVGVIATPRSIESGAYKAAFDRLRKKLDVSYKGCPDLSVYIEKGITDGPEMEALLHSYLDEMVYVQGIGTLLLGCTHYPLVAGCIGRMYPDLKIIDPAENLARNASMLLKVHDFEIGDDRDGNLIIYVSKKTEGFDNMAGILGLGSVPIEEVALK